MLLCSKGKGVEKRKKGTEILVTVDYAHATLHTWLLYSQDQFEFALTAVAEEVNAILKALPQ